MVIEEDNVFYVKKGGTVIMLIYSSSFYIKDNGNGYDLDERDAICSKCHNIIDRQEKYRGINKDWRFSDSKKDAWRYCPYCGENLYGGNK